MYVLQINVLKNENITYMKQKIDITFYREKK